MMARFLFSIFLLAIGIALGATMSTALAERETPLVYVVDFMKVDPMHGGEYERLERETWKAVHEERIERGLMRGWALYAVRYPLGTARPYDYATVNVFDSFEDAELDPMTLFGEVHPDLNAENILDATLEVRELVRGEIWYRLDQAGEAEFSSGH